MSTDVEPTSTASSGWYFSWKKRNGTASARSEGVRRRHGRRVRGGGARGLVTLDSRLRWPPAFSGAGPRRPRGSTSRSCFGILGTVVAARVLGLEEFGVYVTALAAVGFFQVLLDLTVEEPLTKFGFRYAVERGVGKAAQALRPGAAGQVRRRRARGARARRSSRRSRTRSSAPRSRRPHPRRRASAAGAGDRERRRDGAPAPRALRPAGRVPGVRDGASPRRDRDRGPARSHRDARGDGRRAGDRDRRDLRSSGSAAFRRFPSAPAEPLGADRREVISFTLQSSVGTGVVSLRTTLVPLVLGIVAGPTQVGLFRIAQTPQTGLAAASSPARLVLLTDQTRAWEHGRQRERPRRAFGRTRWSRRR